MFSTFALISLALALSQASCTNEFDAVCGADNKTYFNECLASRAGVSSFKGAGLGGSCISATAICHDENGQTVCVDVGIAGLGISLTQGSW
jgi:hypothetical protein